MVRRRSRVRFPFGAPVADFSASGRGFFRFRRRGSSAGQSARLIIVRSRVRAPPPLPTLYSTGRLSDETKRGKQPWQASLRTFAPRSLWPARSARSATTSPRRTVVTRRIVSSWRSTARAATSRRRTARPADGFPKNPEERQVPRGFLYIRHEVLLCVVCHSCKLDE